MGAEAIKELLKKVDLKHDIDEINKELEPALGKRELDY